MPISTSVATLGTVKLAIIPDPSLANRDTQPGYGGQFVTQDSTKTLANRDVPILMDRFEGSGLIKQRGPGQITRVAWVEDQISWMDNGLTLSGARTAKGPGLGLLIGGATATNMIVTDSRNFIGHRYCITNKGIVFRFANDNPADAVIFDPALNSGVWANPTTSLRAGYVCTAIEVFATSTGVPALYVFAYNDAVPATRVYQLLASTGVWSESAAFTTIKIDKAVAPVWWEANDGGGAQRMLVATTSLAGGAPSTTGFVSNTIRHIALGQDPMTEANYVTPIATNAFSGMTDPASAITKLLAFPEFAFARTQNGLWTFNSTRSMNVTPYQSLIPGLANSGVATIYNNAVVMARGFSLDYYDASQAYRRQNAAMDIGPSSHMQDGTPIRGQMTSALQYENALIQTLYNHSNHTTYVGRSYPVDRTSPDSPPVVPFWAEHVMGPSGTNVGQQVTHMAISSPTPVPATVLPDRTVNLWLFTADEPFTTHDFNLFYAPLPNGGGPLSVQVSGGTFAYTTALTRAYLPAIDWGDPLAPKFVRRFDVARALHGKTMALYTRSDGDPTTVTDQTSWVLAATTSLDNDVLTPTSPVSGKSIGFQVTLRTDVGTIGPLFQAFSPRAKVARETFDFRELWVDLEQCHLLSGGSPDQNSAEQSWTTLKSYQDLGQQDFYDETSATVPHKAILEQGVRYTRTRTARAGGDRWQTIAHLTLSIVKT